MSIDLGEMGIVGKFRVVVDGRGENIIFWIWGLGIFIRKVFLGVLDGFLYLEVEEKLELIRIGVRVLKL